MTVERSGAPATDESLTARSGFSQRLPGSDAGLVAAVVVYFRTPAVLAECLDGLRTQTRSPDETVVVDNSSATDGRHERPVAGKDWHWIRADRNLGFGAACNLGAGTTRGEFLLFLNADVVLAPDACEQLRTVAEDHPDVAVVGPRLNGADGGVELSARAFPTAVTGLLGRSSWLTRALSAFNVTPAPLAGALGAGGRVDWISGACMLVRRMAFDQVDGFDEGYWMYWEDADLCRRLTDRGWKVMLWPAASGQHKTGSSGRSDQTIEAFHASAARYYERHVAHTTFAAMFARALLRARLVLMLLRHRRRALS